MVDVQGMMFAGCINLQLLPECGQRPWMWPQQCALWLLDEREAVPGSATAVTMPFCTCL